MESMSESIEATAYPMHRDLSQRDPSLSAGDPFKTEHRGEDIGSLARSDSQRCFADNYAWNAIVVGAIAMVATYPGRTHGLGMVAEPLLSDLGLSDDAGRIQ